VLLLKFRQRSPDRHSSRRAALRDPGRRTVQHVHLRAEL
jgi:hypothetical protein